MPCLDCGRPGVRGRCTTCTRRRDRARGSTTARGYGAEHQAERAAWAEHVAAGEVACVRCGELIDPAEPWDLGHDDHDRSVRRGPEHAGCNRAAGGRRAHTAR